MTKCGSLETRIERLPSKTASVLRTLYAKGNIGHDSLTSILDAGDLSNGQEELLEFAVSFSALSAQGVRMKETIHRAKDQNRRLCLDWSARRWASIHEQLAHATMVRTLAAENTVYDLSAFDKLLPPDARRRLIRTSHRLAMEGLRQRRCVTHDHDSIMRGWSALASVIIDGERWTVELLDPKKDQLVMGHARGRVREYADSAIRWKIRQLFGPNVRSSAKDYGYEPRPKVFRGALTRVLETLRRHRISKATVHFSCCEADELQQRATYSDPGFVGSAVFLDIERPKYVVHDGEGAWRIFEENVSLDQALSDLTEDYVESEEADWHEGDGGFGWLVIDAVSGAVHLEVHVNELETIKVVDKTRQIDG